MVADRGIKNIPNKFEIYHHHHQALRDLRLAPLLIFSLIPTGYHTTLLSMPICIKLSYLGNPQMTEILRYTWIL